MTTHAELALLAAEYEAIQPSAVTAALDFKRAGERWETEPTEGNRIELLAAIDDAIPTMQATLMITDRFLAGVHELLPAEPTSVLRSARIDIAEQIELAQAFRYLIAGDS
jgi:hypothetical protein